MEKLGVVGATGLVGGELIKLLLTSGFKSFKLCASDKSIGKMIHDYYVEPLNEEFFNDLQVVFFCADNATSLKWVPYAIEKNIYVIDNSSAYRKDFPIIIPEINSHLLETSRIIANPNCSTAILCMVLYPLLKLEKIVSVDVCTYQAVSGAGEKAVEEYHKQIEAYSKHEPLVPGVFKTPILSNCFSHNSKMDVESGYNEEEDKIITETVKILDSPIQVSPCCIRIPVERAHTEVIKIVFEKPVEESVLRMALQNFPGISIRDKRETNEFPEPFYSSGKYDISVGKIRKNRHIRDGTVYEMMACGDQLLKGAALNAFQIYLEMKKKYYYV